MSKQKFIDAIALVSMATIFVAVAALAVLGVVAAAKALF